MFCVEVKRVSWPPTPEADVSSEGEEFCDSFDTSNFHVRTMDGNDSGASFTFRCVACELSVNFCIVIGLCIYVCMSVIFVSKHMFCLSLPPVYIICIYHIIYNVYSMFINCHVIVISSIASCFSNAVASG